MKIKPDKLHIGCGGFTPDGWLNTDGSWHVWISRHKILKRIAIILGAIPKEHSKLKWAENINLLDVRYPLPFDDNYFRAVYSSHVLEHLYRDEALRLLKEIYRVCRSGAVVRTIVPDLRTLVDNYIAGVISPKAPGNSPADTFIYNLFMRSPVADGSKGLRRIYHSIKEFNTHKWAYDENSLVDLYHSAGFRNPKRYKELVSNIEDIKNIERPERLGDSRSLIVEAIKE
ncbi:MAG: methyltransferase domain-containing protein [Nitrospirota bacterium]